MIKIGCIVLMFVVFLIIWNFLPHSVANMRYSMKLSRDFPHEVTTNKLGLKFYINDDTLERMKKNPNTIPHVKYE
jgi:hypothetical protein